MVHVIDPSLSSAPQTPVKFHGIHALEGMPFPGEVEGSTARKLLWILAAAGQLKAELDRTYNNSYQQNLKETNSLSESVRYNNYWQAATHIATAFAAVVAGALATKAGMEASSAVTIATKGGDGLTSWLRGTETWMSNTMRQLEHKTSRGSEGGKRLADFVQQLQQAVRTFLDHVSQQKRSH